MSPTIMLNIINYTEIILIVGTSVQGEAKGLINNL